jgi:hypothetical protein
MSILIPGMEMPCEGLMTIIAIGYDGRVFQPIEYPDEHTLYHGTKYKAIDIPPHGRLGDLDALFKAMFQCSDGSIIGDKDIDGWPFEATYADIKRFIRQAPTIIPAEGGADNGQKS